MNINRIRELVAAWQDGSIREAELAELRDALPEVIDRYEATNAIMDEIHTWYRKLTSRVDLSYPDKCGSLWDKLCRARND